MPDLQELEAEGKRADGPARVFCLQSRREIQVPLTESFMREASDSNARNHRGSQQVAKTVVILEIEHEGELPEKLKGELERRAYQYIHSQGYRCKNVLSMPLLEMKDEKE